MSDVSRLIARLKDLRDRLEKFDVEVGDDFMKLDSAWKRLDDSWEGQAYQEFTGLWEQSRNTFKHYIDISYKYEQFLRERIDALEEFERSGGLS